MSGKPKRRYSDSDAEQMNSNPFLTSPPTSEFSQQTAPANPFASLTPDSSNPFSSSLRSGKTMRPINRQKLSLSSLPDDCKLRVEGFDPLDSSLGHKIKKVVNCFVRVYREKGWALLTFDTNAKAREVLEKGLEVEGHPHMTFMAYHRPEKKKNVFDRLDNPKQPHTITPPQTAVPTRALPPLPTHSAVHSSTQPDPRREMRPDTDREEKLFQLEQRDSQLREQVKQGRETAIGTCEDMCPEKERFWREERHCLSSYELLPGAGYAVDHSAAVKEFSRSAADKLQPLPHELRTEAALQRTLLYLCHRIMPAQPYSRDWYGFLSNRLEALRQDITIQHLCSLRSVRVVEACARYHTLCSHLLLEVGLENSDLEMNDMKLRSILTPLLQMYRDLRPDGVLSPDEPIFVSLSLILAIQTGLISYDLLLLTDDVISSQPVQFVLQVWRAVSCEDYVRFFQLLRRADFLTASLMNRFVPDMRFKGLRQMSSSSRQGDQADTKRVTRLFCFDDASQCAALCSQAGLQCDTNSLHLSNNTQMEATCLRGLSLSLIRYKSTCELGEVVYGGPLPPIPSLTPSFSPQSQQQQLRISWQSAVRELGEQQLLECLESVLLSEMVSVTEEVLRERQRSQLIGQLSEQLCAELLSVETADYVAEMARCEVEREGGERRRKEERRVFIGEAQLELFDQLLSEEVSGVVRCEVEEEREYRAVVARSVEAVSAESYCQLEREVLEQLMSEEGESAVREAKQRRKERLEERRREVVLRRLRNKWEVWRDAFVLRERRKEAVRRFPKLPSDRVERGQWSLGPVSVLQELVLPEQLERVSCLLKERREQAERERRQLVTPLYIPQLLGKTLLNSRCEEGADWLLLLVVSGGGPVADWLLEVLGGRGGEDRSNGHVCTLSDCETWEADRQVRVRVRLAGEACPPSELKGCSAVLLLAEGSSQSAVRERLKLLRGVKRMPQLPLCVLHTHPLSSQLLTSPPCVGEVRVTPLPTAPCQAGRTELESSLQWLAAHSSAQPRLSCQRLREFVGDRMYSLFSKPTAGHAADRERLGVRGPSLRCVSALYSSALSCVREEVAGARAQELNWPIRDDGEVWGWNEDHRLKEVRTAIGRLRLAPGDREDERVEEFLRGYRHLPSILSECDSLLTRHFSRMKRLGLPICPPWAHIIETVMHSAMQRAEYDYPVCYESDKRTDLRLPREWMRSLDELSSRSVCIAPALRRQMNSNPEARKLREVEKRKRSSLSPTLDRSCSPEELARKTARLELERSLARLEGQVQEEMSRTQHSTAHLHSLIESADDVSGLMTSWEQQLQRVETELRLLRDSSSFLHN